jgi:hypothetical protein
MAENARAGFNVCVSGNGDKTFADILELPGFARNNFLSIPAPNPHCV